MKDLIKKLLQKFLAGPCMVCGSGKVWHWESHCDTCEWWDRRHT